MRTHIDFYHNNQLLKVSAFTVVSGSLLDWEADHSDVKVIYGKTDIFKVIDDTDLMEKIYKRLDEEAFVNHFGDKHQQREAA